MKRIKVLYHTNNLAFGGGWRKQEWTIEMLNRELFDPYVTYNESDVNQRLFRLKQILPPDRIFPFKRSKKNKNKTDTYEPKSSNLFDIIHKISPDIIHFARSGYAEWPFTERLAKLQIETNIFGFQDKTHYLDKSICLTKYLSDRRGGSDAVIPNPIPSPYHPGDMRYKLGIPRGSIVFGRIGDDSSENYDEIALKAFLGLSKKYNNIYYLCVAPHKEFRGQSDKIIFLDKTYDDKAIAAFYETIDVFAHYRKLGETFGTAIAQALSYGKPVLSHTVEEVDFYHSNGHLETIADCGLAAKDLSEYRDNMDRLIRDKTLRDDLSKKAVERWIFNYRQDIVVKKIEDCYWTWFYEKLEK